MPGTAGIRLAITGANSAVGRAIVRASMEWRTGVELVACVRSEHAAGELQPWMERIRLARIAYDDPNSLSAAFHGASAIVHLAGTLIERPGSTYQDAHVETTRIVLEAAKACGVNCIVYVSAIGADPSSRNRYWRTKGQAEMLVCQSDLRYTILRPPLLLGPDTEGTTTLRRSLRQGRATMINGGRTVQQPLDVGDLARAALVAADGLAGSGRILDLVGPVALTEREILERAAVLAGSRVRIRSLPKALLSFVLAVRDRTGFRGFSRDALDVITADTRLDSQRAATALGIDLTGIDDVLRRSVL